ncbi:LysR family transcriptional regulator [Roseomonas nepalensis]|uniref:LysR family transcriptional regulator n=1 Tax=Muricoccus nepalensis TaxID=1854500 RepID=A0A502G2E2_9PROT|nr:LysR family transcriptional regulator [Roseomonas nepalensis]TPG55720.1 LysR family transcriptional regulator [Roseomonas nepalensis]
MDLRHARTFVAVAELGTVSRAAERLRIAQPALSRQIADLEGELGIRLFDRVGRRLMLTGAGEQLLGDCRALLGAAGAIGERARALQHGDAGLLRVASSPQIIEGALSAFLIRYAEAYPKVRVTLTEVMGWAATAAKLESGESYLGQNLMGAVPPDDARFACQPLEAIELLAAFNPSLGLEAGGVIEIGRLAPHPLLLLDTDYVFRRNFDGACRLAGLRPNIAYESRTPHTLLAMAESGHGVAIVPSVLRTDRYRLHVAALAYRGEPLRERTAIYWDRRRPLPRYAEAFCDMLGAYMREVFPISRPTVL